MDLGRISGMDKSETTFILAHDMLTSFKTTQVQIDNMLQCSVCLTFFGVNEDAKMLPCGHAYHEGCIFPWLRVKANCPDCRRELVPQEGPEVEQEEGELESTWEDDEPWTVTLSHSGRHVEVLESAGGVIFIEPISPVSEDAAADASVPGASPAQPEDDWEEDEPWTVTLSHPRPGVQIVENAGGLFYVETVSPDPNIEESLAEISQITESSVLSPRPESESSVIEISSDESDSYPLPPKRRYEHRSNWPSSSQAGDSGSSSMPAPWRSTLAPSSTAQADSSWQGGSGSLSIPAPWRSTLAPSSSPQAGSSWQGGSRSSFIANWSKPFPPPPPSRCRPGCSDSFSESSSDENCEAPIRISLSSAGSVSDTSRESLSSGSESDTSNESLSSGSVSDASNESLSSGSVSDTSNESLSSEDD